MIYRLLSIALLTVITSCVATTPLYYDELKPSEFSIDKRVAKVGIINLATPQRDINHHIIFDTRKPYGIDSLWNDQFSDIVLETFRNDLVSKNYFDSVWVDTTKTNLNRLLIEKTLTYILDSIAIENDLNGIFFISKTNYQTILHLEPLNDTQIWGYFQGNSSLNLGFYNAVTSQFEDNATKIDTLYLDGQIGTIEQLRKSIMLPKDFAALMAQELGGKIKNRYIPFWQKTDRMLYTGGSYHLNEANKFVKENDWPNATRVWNYSMEKGDDLSRARVAFNLAVMAEMQGDIKSALNWLYLSKDLYTTKKNRSFELKLVEQYISILSIRESELAKLTNQIETTK